MAADVLVEDPQFLGVKIEDMTIEKTRKFFYQSLSVCRK
jgi:hypothetical protein